MGVAVSDLWINFVFTRDLDDEEGGDPGNHRGDGNHQEIGAHECLAFNLGVVADQLGDVGNRDNADANHSHHTILREIHDG